MKFTLLLAVSLILCVWRFQIADCRVATPITSSGNLTVESSLPRYFKPNQYPSGYNLSYGSESTWNKEPRKPYLPSDGSRAIQVDSVTDDELLEISEVLYSLEVYLLNQISVNVQGKTRSSDTNDLAPEPLLKVSDKVLSLPTIAKLRALFDNYVMDTSVAEVFTKSQLQEQDDFIDAVMGSNVMRKTMSFLQAKGILSADQRRQREYLKTIWFTLYNRGQGALGSSGFEHVFLCEVNNGKIIGLHNWCYFSEEEKAGRLDYKGYINFIKLGNKGECHENRFTHNGLIKPVNTILVGTSPELEMALYTICLQFRPDQMCRLSLGGKPFAIQTYIWRQAGQVLIGSAFPKLRD